MCRGGMTSGAKKPKIFEPQEAIGAKRTFLTIIFVDKYSLFLFLLSHLITFKYDQLKIYLTH